MKVIVIGGGASGLVSAIEASRRGAKVTILERNNKCGKKLLLTGNSRCNFWNSDIELSHYHTSSSKVLEEILMNNQKFVLPFFKSIGIIPKVINGYYYPYSNQSLTVLNTLLWTATNLKVDIKYEELVQKIIKERKFCVYTENNCYEADKVIIATGGMSYPKTGSDGNGYKLVEAFGHSLNTPLPTLVQLRSKDNFYKELKGVRSEVILTVFEENKKIKSEQGEILFTDYGLSGICTFNISGIISRGLNQNKKEEVFINFVPWFKGSKNDLLEWFDHQAKQLNNYTLSQILEGFLNYKIVNLILKLCSLKADSSWSTSPKEKIASYLLHFPFRVKETNTFLEAEATSGGVPLEEINPKTMESKKVKGLYLTGEILDVDGVCGGYNLGFAWITGLIASKGVTEND